MSKQNAKANASKASQPKANAAKANAAKPSPKLPAITKGQIWQRHTRCECREITHVDNRHQVVGLVHIESGKTSTSMFSSLFNNYYLLKGATRDNYTSHPDYVTPHYVTPRPAAPAVPDSSAVPAPSTVPVLTPALETASEPAPETAPAACEVIPVECASTEQDAKRFIAEIEKLGGQVVLVSGEARCTGIAKERVDDGLRLWWGECKAAVREYLFKVAHFLNELEDRGFEVVTNGKTLWVSPIEGLSDSDFARIDEHEKALISMVMARLKSAEKSTATVTDLSPVAAPVAEKIICAPSSLTLPGMGSESQGNTMTYDEATRYLGVGARSLYRWTKRGLICPAPQKGRSGGPLYYEADIMALLDKVRENPLSARNFERQGHKKTGAEVEGETGLAPAVPKVAPEVEEITKAGLVVQPVVDSHTVFDQCGVSRFTLRRWEKRGLLNCLTERGPFGTKLYLRSEVMQCLEDEKKTARCPKQFGVPRPAYRTPDRKPALELLGEALIEAYEAPVETALESPVESLAPAPAVFTVYEVSPSESLPSVEHIAMVLAPEPESSPEPELEPEMEIIEAEIVEVTPLVEAVEAVEASPVEAPVETVVETAVEAPPAKTAYQIALEANLNQLNGRSWESTPPQGAPVAPVVMVPLRPSLRRRVANFVSQLIGG